MSPGRDLPHDLITPLSWGLNSGDHPARGRCSTHIWILCWMNEPGQVTQVLWNSYLWAGSTRPPDAAAGRRWPVPLVRLQPVPDQEGTSALGSSSLPPRRQYTCMECREDTQNTLRSPTSRSWKSHWKAREMQGKKPKHKSTDRRLKKKDTDAGLQQWEEGGWWEGEVPGRRDGGSRLWRSEESAPRVGRFPLCCRVSTLRGSTGWSSLGTTLHLCAH